MFKDTVGRWLTKSLFYEANDYKIDSALFTLGDEDVTIKGKPLISLRKRFVDSDDPTGWAIAQEFLGGYSHWDAICNSASLRGEVEKWQEELEVKLRSIGLANTIKSARAGNFNASKFLSEKGWVKRIAGRPSKDEVTRELKVQTRLRDEFEDDLKRMEVLNGEGLPLN